MAIRTEILASNANLLSEEDVHKEITEQRRYQYFDNQ